MGLANKHCKKALPVYDDPFKEVVRGTAITSVRKGGLTSGELREVRLTQQMTSEPLAHSSANWSAVLSSAR